MAWRRTCIYFDRLYFISKAFDLVNYQILLAMLKQCGIAYIVIIWILVFKDRPWPSEIPQGFLPSSIRPTKRQAVMLLSSTNSSI